MRISVGAMAALAMGGSAHAQPVGDPEAGREAFGAECRTCHAGAIAPTLRGVVGRGIAGAADYPAYSDALKARAGDTWTDERLAAFLKAPAEFAPGTRMEKAVPDDQMRADIVAYLKSLPPPQPQ